MLRIDDETLMAYVDGELESAEMDRVREAIAGDETLDKRARMFRRSARVLRDAFRDQLDVPVPGRLEALLLPYSAPVIPGVMARLRASWIRPPSLAFAAGLLLTVGAIVGHLATLPDAGMHGATLDRLTLVQGSFGWNQGFERTPSGEQFTLQAPDGKDVGIAPLASFLDAGDRFCRSFRQAGETAIVRRGIACRDDAGSWSPVVVVVESAPAASGSNASGYRAASADGDSIFDRVLEMQMTTSPFEPGEEREFIKNGWHLAP